MQEKTESRAGRPTFSAPGFQLQLPFRADHGSNLSGVKLIKP